MVWRLAGTKSFLQTQLNSTSGNIICIRLITPPPALGLLQLLLGIPLGTGTRPLLRLKDWTARRIGTGRIVSQQRLSRHSSPISNQLSHQGIYG